MGSSGIFSRSDAWSGGCYELDFLLGPKDDEGLAAALKSLWDFPDVDGCYLDLFRDPERQPRVAAGEVVGLETRLHGVARIGGAEPIACATVVIRFENDPTWLAFCLPMGSLGHIFPVGAYPFEDGTDLAWRAEVDEWLCRMARHVFQFVTFYCGLVGWEPHIHVDELPTINSIPEERSIGYLIPENGLLRWYAPIR